MSYTNGFNIEKATAALTGRLGWKDESLDQSNRTSNSGRYFDDGTFHATVLVPNIKAVVPAPDDWDQWFTDKQKAVIQKCLKGVFADPQYKEQVLIYDRVSELEQEIANNNLAVGYRISVAKSFDIALQVRSCNLYFNQDVTFSLYLFKQGRKTPLKQQAVTAKANEVTTVALADWFLSYNESSLYYIVYFESELGGAKAIQEIATLNTSYQFGALPVLAPANEQDFDRVYVQYAYMPRGLNLQIDSFKDYTQDIVKKAYLFDEALGLMMATMVLESIFYSTESSSKERMLKETAQAAIHLEVQGALPMSDGPQVQSIRSRIEKELQRIKEAFTPKAQPVSISLCS